MKMTSKIGATVLAALALTSAAQALPYLNGGIRMTANGSTASVNYTTNTVTFAPNNVGNAKVDTVDGVLASFIVSGDLVDYKNFTYAPLTVTGGQPIWSIPLKGLTFDLLSVSSFTEALPGSVPATPLFAGLTISGTGLLKRAGYENTTGFWSFSADSTNGGTTFGWSSTVQGVPDGGTTMALLGFSLLGLHGARRKFAKA